jgi:hypothetical protein
LKCWAVSGISRTLESPTAVVKILDDFIATTGPRADLANRKT